MDFPSNGISNSELYRRIKYLENISNSSKEGREKELNDHYRLYGLPELRALVEDVMIRFMESTPSFPSDVGIRQMEEEVISMVGGLWDAKSPQGMMTSGSTESNIVALYTAKNQ